MDMSSRGLSTWEEQRSHYAEVSKRIAKAGEAFSRLGVELARRQPPVQTVIPVAIYPAPIGPRIPAIAQKITMPSKVRKIVEAISARHNVTVEEIFGSSRVRRIARARSDACHSLVEGLGYSLGRAGRALGRDHTTVLHSVNRINDLWKRGEITPFAETDDAKEIFGREAT